MWTKGRFASKLGRLVVRGLVRWLEMLGENPPLSRDHGILAWRALHGEDGTDQAGKGAPSGEPGHASGPPLAPPSLAWQSPIRSRPLQPMM